MQQKMCRQSIAFYAPIQFDRDANLPVCPASFILLVRPTAIIAPLTESGAAKFHAQEDIPT
jgi:hypothetical protein